MAAQDVNKTHMIEGHPVSTIIMNGELHPIIDKFSNYVTKKEMEEYIKNILSTEQYNQKCFKIMMGE